MRIDDRGKKVHKTASTAMWNTAWRWQTKKKRIEREANFAAAAQTNIERNR